MSTKRLSKTVIEGGRIDSNKYDRRKSHKWQRAAERAYLSKITKDPESFDEDIVSERQHIYKEFGDKLSPMYRWLDDQVGRSWDEVRSEVFQKFDTRTTAGRHITFDHLLSNVIDTLSGRDERGRIAANIVSYSPRFSYYYVDDCGILRKTAAQERNWRYYKTSEQELEAASKWLAGRMIGEKGGKLYWFSNNEGAWKASWDKVIKKDNLYGFRESPLALRYFIWENGFFEKQHIYPTPFHEYPGFMIKNHGLHWEHVENPSGFKQRGELTASEIKEFKALNPGIRAEILAFGNARF